MAAPFLVNIDELDESVVEYGIEEIRKYIPQRDAFELLHGVFKIWNEEKVAVGYRDVGCDEFWVSGHIPGRPIFPGVLMIEAGAQLATFLMKKLTGDAPERFLGFGGLEHVRFRCPVEPGQRLILLSRVSEVRSRRCIFDVQGAVNRRLVFEAQVIGVPV